MVAIDWKTSNKKLSNLSKIIWQIIKKNKRKVWKKMKIDRSKPYGFERNREPNMRNRVLKEREKKEMIKNEKAYSRKWSLTTNARSS